MNFLLGFLLFVVSLGLIGLILIQRGRGGGLAGAFGGAGGQSAFGAKAGDTFTRITIGAAFAWILLCAITVKLAGNGGDLIDPSLGGGMPPTGGAGTTATGAAVTPSTPAASPATTTPSTPAPGTPGDGAASAAAAGPPGGAPPANP